MLKDELTKGTPKMHAGYVSSLLTFLHFYEAIRNVNDGRGGGFRCCTDSKKTKSANVFAIFNPVSKMRGADMSSASRRASS